MSLLERQECESDATPGLDLAKKTLEDIYIKYSGDPQIFAKMHNYVCFRLPGVIDEMKRASDERRVRNEYLSTEQDTFITSFLNDNQYFYCPQTELFFYYNGLHYLKKREDDVLHHVLTSITKDCNTLIPRKPQTKVYIMKRVKESNPLKSIPESATIQDVLDSLYPTLFSTKSAAKYFLTILGDHLLKKIDDSTHAYFTTPKAKEFLREVASVSQSLFGQSAVSQFKYKYHSHPFRTVRLVQMNDSVGVESVWRPILQMKSIDLLCVAAHYSGRYESADQYLESYSDDADLAKYATHFRWKTASEVVGEFATEYLRVSDSRDLTIESNTMEYLWKKYLKDRRFPAILGSNAFSAAIVERFPDKYDAATNTFRGISSSHACIVDRFRQFWGESIIVDKSDNLAEYEIDELVMMYRCKFADENNRITDSQMLDLIRFYEDVEIVDSKFVQGVKSVMWDKQEELRVFFAEIMKINEARKLTESDSITFYDAYSSYQRYCKNGRSLADKKRKTIGGQMISKNYFEKYAYESFENVADNKFWF